MSKKVKCCKCKNSMHWAIPVRVGEKNIEYAKYVLELARKSIVCGDMIPSRSRNIDHEQYCKKFKKMDDSLRENVEKCFENELLELEEKIREYEAN
ncbi:MAG: hypothetical protein PHV18_11085 [Lachnospiraceae bacterium]|nr:hypothetical protein [Lachnospiraceae bacterium]